MSLDIVEALRNGLSDTLTRNGLIFAAITYLISIVSTVSGQSMASGLMPSTLGTAGATGAAQTPLAMSGPAALWGFISFAAWITGAVLSIGIIRTFAAGETEAINTDYFSDDILMTTLNFIVGGIVYGLLVALGTILLVIPGIFLAVSLVFWNIYIAEEGYNFIEALQQSWNTTKGNRIGLFLLGLGVLVASLVIGLVFGIPSMALGFLSPAVAALISNIGSAFTSVFVLATLVNAYHQLTA